MSGSSTHSNDKPQRRAWIWLSLIGVVLVAAVSAAVLFLLPNNAPTAPAADDPFNLAEVVITDLTQEETFNGKLESIKGTGTLISPIQMDLGFSTPGTLIEVPLGGQARPAGCWRETHNLLTQSQNATSLVQLGSCLPQHHKGGHFNVDFTRGNRHATIFGTLAETERNDSEQWTRCVACPAFSEPWEMKPGSAS